MSEVPLYPDQAIWSTRFYAHADFRAQNRCITADVHRKSVVHVLYVCGGGLDSQELILVVAGRHVDFVSVLLLTPVRTP